jgi:hypothetical protein
MRITRLVLLPVLLTLGTIALALVPASVSADNTLFGARVGYYTGAGDPFAGVEVVFPIEVPELKKQYEQLVAGGLGGIARDAKRETRGGHAPVGSKPGFTSEFLSAGE